MKQKMVRLSIVFMLSVLVFVMGKGYPASALEIGKTYDKSNYQEIQDLVHPQMLNWLKNGTFAIKVGELTIPWGDTDQTFKAATLANKGKYKIDDRRILVESSTNDFPKFVVGFPFPEIDLKDPQAGQMIMENQLANREHALQYSSTASLTWVGSGGAERELKTGGDYFFYFQRLAGPVENPNLFRKQSLTNVQSPYDLKGTISLSWEYLDDKENTNFSYVPMLRRVRRTSSAASSDPSMGSDLCNDDAAGWAGKNFNMGWKYLGEQTILCPFLADEIKTQTIRPDGSFTKTVYPEIAGYEQPGWQYATYCPVNTFYAPRPCYMIEGTPKDPYYNYGRHIFYVDQKGYNIFYKVIYDKGGQYWKSVNLVWSMQEVPDKWRSITSELYFPVDDKSNHSTWARIISYEGRTPIFNTSITKINPDYFTTSNLIQLSK
jgi:hypothetical protein